MNSLLSPAERHAAAMAELGITEEVIERLVRTFYAKLRRDPDLGPIFEAKIPQDWEPHLRTMMDFWSSVVLMSGRFKGNPVLKHRQLSAVSPDHFTIWLALFRATAQEVCPAGTAALFTDRAERIAESLKHHMFRPADECRPDA